MYTRACTKLSGGKCQGSKGNHHDIGNNMRKTNKIVGFMFEIKSGDCKSEALCNIEEDIKSSLHKLVRSWSRLRLSLRQDDTNNLKPVMGYTRLNRRGWGTWGATEAVPLCQNSKPMTINMLPELTLHITRSHILVEI